MLGIPITHGNCPADLARLDRLPTEFFIPCEWGGKEMIVTRKHNCQDQRFEITSHNNNYSKQNHSDRAQLF
jgi:hypothetical protein